MADYIVQMKQFNGSTYDNIYPLGTGGVVYFTVTPAMSGITITLSSSEKTFSGVTNSSGVASIIINRYNTYSISCSNEDVVLSQKTIDIYFSGEYHITGKYMPLATYTIRIDETNSNSETAIIYQDDAVGMTKGSSDWDSLKIFKDIKPCVFTNGAVSYYLNPNDFTKKVDGTAATLSGAGDVMIEFSKFAYRIYRSGNYLYVSITNDPSKVSADSGFKYNAFSRSSDGDRSKMYIGAYKGYTNSGRLHSWSGYSPTVNQTIDTFRTQAQANGTGYQQFTFYQLTALQCLFLIKYGSLDSQTALGRGYVDGNSSSRTTGVGNTSGMYYGSTSTVKFAGIEDFWGNVYDWIDGLFCNSSRYILTSYKSFNDKGSGYTSNGQEAPNLSGYISHAQGTTNTGFIVKTTSGSDTTYFADYGWLGAYCLPEFGGDWRSGSYAGAFSLDVDSSASDAKASIGARLSYC